MEELAAGQKPGGAEERGEGSQFAYFSNCPLSFPSPPSASLGTCRSCPFFFLCVPSPFLQHSLCCHSAVCLYFPCCQLRAWPQWQPWQLQTLCGPRYSLPGTPAERKEKGGKKENLNSRMSASLANL